jgi:hypothetical protein
MKKNVFIPCPGLFAAFALAFVFTACDNGGKTAVNPVVTNVVIKAGDDDAPTVLKGGGVQFTATVTGTNLVAADKAVTWNVVSGASTPVALKAGTGISETGYLTVAVDEENNTLKVTATSKTTTSVTSAPVEVTLEFAGKTVIITGLEAYDGQDTLSLSLYVISGFPRDENTVARNSGAVINGQAIFELLVPSEDWPWDPWNDNGEYWLMLQVGFLDAPYLYTDGGDFNATLTGNAKYNITQKKSTVAFSRFKQIETGIGGHQLTITGIGSEYNNATAEVQISSDNGARGYGTIANGSVTFSLIADADGISGWTGSGACYVMLDVTVDGVQTTYIYTDGKTLAQLGINDTSELDKAEKYTFSGNSTGIAFNKFVSLDGLSDPGTTVTVTGGVPDADWTNINLYKNGDSEEYGNGEIEGGTATYFIAYWARTGSYQIKLNLGGFWYAYTGGLELAALGITGYNDVDEKIPEYDFTSSGPSIPFSNFKPLIFSGSSDGGTITITGITGFTRVTVDISNDEGEWGTVYSGEGTITGGVAEVASFGIPYGGGGAVWDGTGSFRISIVTTPYKEYAYTGGKELAEFGITDMGNFYPDQLPLYDFDTNPNTIDLGQFRCTSDLEW